WKMKPSFWLRMRARARAESVATSSPSSQYRPPLGESRHPRMCISVDLPEPDGPVIETNSPAPMLQSTPRNACTAFSPESYVLVTFSSVIRSRAGAGSSYLSMALRVASRLVVVVVLLLVLRQGRIFERQLLAALHALEDLDAGVVGEAGDDGALLEEGLPG